MQILDFFGGDKFVPKKGEKIPCYFWLKVRTSLWTTTGHHRKLPSWLSSRTKGSCCPCMDLVFFFSSLQAKLLISCRPENLPVPGGRSCHFYSDFMCHVETRWGRGGQLIDTLKETNHVQTRATVCAPFDLRTFRPKMSM